MPTVRRYEGLLISVKRQANRLNQIHRSAPENNIKNRHVQAYEKGKILSNRKNEITALLGDDNFFNELKDSLPEKLRARLDRTCDSDVDFDDQLQAAFTFAYLKRDLRATRGWFRNLNIMTATSGNTTSYDAVLGKALELGIDMRLVNHFQRLIEDPVKNWPIPDKNSRQDLVTVKSRLVFDDQRGEVGHAGTQIFAETHGGQKSFFKVEGFGSGVDYKECRNETQKNFHPQVLGKARKIDFPPQRLTPSQFKLLRYNLKGLGNQRYSLLKYNCSHVSRRALRFSGINLPSRLKPKNLIQSGIKQNLKTLEKSNKLLDSTLAKGIEKGTISSEKINETVVGRLRNEMQRLKLEITQQKVSRFTVHVDRKQKKIDLLKSLVNNYDTLTKSGMEPSKAITQALKTTRNAFGSREFKNKLFEGRTRKCIVGLMRPLAIHSKQNMPIRNQNRETARIYSGVGKHGEDYVGMQFGLVRIETGFSMFMSQVDEDKLSDLRKNIRERIAGSGSIVEKDQALAIVKECVREFFDSQML